MLFYEFFVSRKSPLAYNHERPTEARVMVRMDSDVNTCTDEAVEYLSQRGWLVTGVRHAQVAESMDEFSTDETLLRLYQSAMRQGIACAISAMRNVAQLVGSSEERAS